MSELEQLGTSLVEAGVLTKEALGDALAEHAATRKSLGRVLLEEGLVSEADLVSVLAERLGLEYVDLAEYPVDSAAAGLVSDALVMRYEALPIGWEDGRLLVAMADPSNVVAVDDIRTITRSDVKVVVSTRSAILQAVAKHRRIEGVAADMSAQAAKEVDLDEELSAGQLVQDAPIVKLVNMLISQAVTERASDIHIEPAEKDVRIRYRLADEHVHQLDDGSVRDQLAGGQLLVEVHRLGDLGAHVGRHALDAAVLGQGLEDGRPGRHHHL
ncbi:MAG TPA: hypothetical protein VHE80_03980, partial [Acidimicrobiales bacterium]|nr:hypothetical protein [Acidimicrobiales bacterium]